MIEPPITHVAGCPEGATKTRRGTKGDLIRRCIACGRFAVIPEPEPAPEPEPKPAPDPLPELPLHLSRYRCRVHHSEAVTWRGTGCLACSQGAA